MKDKLITSKDNPVFKNALKLLRRKYRDETGTYLLEGVKPIEDAIGQGIEIKTIFVRESDVEKETYTVGKSGTGSEQVTGREFLSGKDSVITLSDNLFNQLSDTETSRGVIAIVSKRLYEIDCCHESTKDLKKSDESSIIILDRLQDPGNIGTIIRTAEAAGLQAVVAVKGTADIYSPKVVRAAAGSILRMDIATGMETDKVVSFCRKHKRQIIVTALVDAESCFETDLTHSAIVIGNEGNGVSSEFIAAADKKVKIPMEGEIESLNAAVAAGVLMFEAARQNTAGKVK